MVYSYLPLDADLLGLDPVRLPSDGRVPIFQKANVVVVHNTQSVTLPNPAVAGSTINCARVRIARVRLEDALGVRVPDDRIASTDLDAGTVTLANPLDLTGYTQPLKLYHTIEDMALLTDVEIGGRLTFNRSLSHTFPANTSWVSSALIVGDIWARYANLFTQATWTGEWSDSPIGSGTTGQYNDVLYPLQVTNQGATEERWRVEFTSSSAFKVVGETLGQIGTGTLNADFEILNPATNAPYFFIDYRGWGGGWATGNVVRFNTKACNYPAWFARTVRAGPASGTSDSFRQQLRGDVDA